MTVPPGYHQKYAPVRRWLSNPAPGVKRSVEQLWFVGVHSNVGGGYAEHELSDVTLFWMCSKLDQLLEIDDNTKDFADLACRARFQLEKILTRPAGVSMMFETGKCHGLLLEAPRFMMDSSSLTFVMQIA